MIRGAEAAARAVVEVVSAVCARGDAVAIRAAALPRDEGVRKHRRSAEHVVDTSGRREESTVRLVDAVPAQRAARQREASTGVRNAADCDAEGAGATRCTRAVAAHRAVRQRDDVARRRVEDAAERVARCSRCAVSAHGAVRERHRTPAAEVRDAAHDGVEGHIRSRGVSAHGAVGEGQACAVLVQDAARDVAERSHGRAVSPNRAVRERKRSVIQNPARLGTIAAGDRQVADRDRLSHIHGQHGARSLTVQRRSVASRKSQVAGDFERSFARTLDREGVAVTRGRKRDVQGIRIRRTVDRDRRRVRRPSAGDSEDRG